MNTPDSLSLEEALQKRPGAPPFTFAMTDARGKALRLHCTEVLHTGFGERGVFRVFWQGRETLAKIYCGRSALRMSRRETRAYKLAHEAGLPTPELLHEAKRAGRRAALLLFAYLPNAYTLTRAVMNAGGTAKEIQLYEKMLDLITTMHRRGLHQKDCHPGNFLFCGERLYVTDLETVRPIRSRWTRVCNLSKAINRQPASIRPALLQLLEKKYRIKLRPWQLDLRHSLDLGNMRRMVRDGRRNFVVFRKRDRLIAYRRNFWFKPRGKIIRAPEAVAARGEILQQTQGRRTVRAAAEDGGLLLQCYDPPRGLQALRPSRAWRRWQNSHLLNFGARGDIRPPRALACVEERRGPFRGRSWLVHDPIPGESLAAVTRAGPPPDSVDESLRKAFVAFYTLRALPQDLRAEGFIVHQEGGGGDGCSSRRWKMCGIFKVAEPAPAPGPPCSARFWPTGRRLIPVMRATGKCWRPSRGNPRSDARPDVFRNGGAHPQYTMLPDPVKTKTPCEVRRLQSLTTA